MDGKDAWRDNVFVERLWRSVKYEEVYLRAYDSVSEARASIGRYFDFYNGRRPHASLDGNTPDQAYFNPCPSAWQPNPGRTPLSDAENLFREPGPLQYGWRMSVPEHADNSRGGCCSTQAGQAPKSCGLRPRPRFRNSGYLGIAR